MKKLFVEVEGMKAEFEITEDRNVVLKKVQEFLRGKDSFVITYNDSRFEQTGERYNIYQTFDGKEQTDTGNLWSAISMFLDYVENKDIVEYARKKLEFENSLKKGEDLNSYAKSIRLNSNMRYFPDYGITIVGNKTRSLSGDVWINESNETILFLYEIAGESYYPVGKINISKRTYEIKAGFSVVF